LGSTGPGRAPDPATGRPGLGQVDMDLTSRFLGGLPPGVLTAVLLFLLGTLTLVFSMIVASRLAGGIDFGPPSVVVPRGAALLAAVTAIHFIDCGVLLAGPVWFFGLMFLFHLDHRQTRTLTKVNWGMNLVWKVLLMLAAL
jgi:hypothetical protein